MKKKIGILAVLAILSLSLFLSVAFADTQSLGDRFKFPVFISEELRDIFDNETYDDLVAFRDKDHRNFILWIQPKFDSLDTFRPKN
ncbi:MAG: hypothetical protein U9O53_04750 [archaeon]|nr:hypothetical protein [archaeon]